MYKVMQQIETREVFCACEFAQWSEAAAWIDNNGFNYPESNFWIEQDPSEDPSDCYDADPGEMDGDHASALASAGWGTDEDYGNDRDDGWDF